MLDIYQYLFYFKKHFVLFLIDMNFNDYHPFYLGIPYDTNLATLDFIPYFFSKAIPSGRWMRRNRIHEKSNCFSSES